MSDLSLPVTHNLLHAVTLSSTLSSEKRGQVPKKQVQLEQAEKQYTETVTCYVTLKVTKSKISSPASNEVITKGTPQETTITFIKGNVSMSCEKIICTMKSFVLNL